MTDQKAFLSRTLHDLRNPLSSILGYGELLEDLQTDPEAKKYAALVVSKARSMTLLLEEISDLFWHEQGQKPVVAPEKLDLQALAEAALERIMADYPGSRWTWGTAKPSSILADRSKTRKMILALLNNAATHGLTPEGTFLSLEHQGTQAALILEDRGPGIPDKVLADLGRPFNQGPGTSGSGLGLAWVRLLAEIQEGTLKVENTPQGCRVVLRLPLA